MKHVLSTIFLCLTACAWMVPTAHAFDEQPVRLVYAQRSGETTTSKEYLVEKTPRGCRIQLFNGNVKRTIVSNEETGTTVEEYIHPVTGDALTFRRLGDVLRLSGTLDGKAVDREFPMDGIWYGSALLLRDFALSDEPETQFYMTRPKEKRVVKLTALRQGTEQIVVGGRTFQAVKIAYTAPGFRGMFRKSHYWYRTSDGLLVKTEETRGLPGAPKVRNELTSENTVRQPPVVAELF